MAINSHYYGLILAGGRGTRFWPRSRKKRAKQVLNFFGDRSLIQLTADRLRPMLPPERIWIVTNDLLRDEIIRQLPEVPKHQILAEPAARNTAPAIGLVAQILQRADPKAVMGVFPADQLIEKPARYLRLLKPAFKKAAEGQVAVMGIQPRWAETGFGYIEFPDETQPGDLAVHQLNSFREKPDLETAEKFVKAGNFYWNAGMFFWRTDVFLGLMQKHMPKTAELLAALPPLSSRRFKSALGDNFPQCENISVDFGIMEKASPVFGVAADNIGWNDVGSWNAVYELQAGEAGANVSQGDWIAERSSGNYIDVPGKLVALLGVDNLVIVETGDALLIADRGRSQQVGDIVKMLEKRNRDDLL